MKNIILIILILSIYACNSTNEKAPEVVAVEKEDNKGEPAFSGSRWRHVIKNK